MDRRDFLKGALKASGTAIAVGAAGLSLDREQAPTNYASFQKGTLRRERKGVWFFEFETRDEFDISGWKELLVEIGDSAYLLKEPESIESVDLESYVIHRISGKGWEKIDRKTFLSMKPRGG